MTVTIDPAAATAKKSYDQSGFEILATPTPVISLASANQQTASSKSSVPLTTLQTASKQPDDSSKAVLAAASTQNTDPQVVNSGQKAYNHVGGFLLAVLTFASIAVML